MSLKNYFRNLFSLEKAQALEARRAREAAAKAQAAKDHAARRLAEARDDWYRLNFYQLYDFLAGRTGENATPPPASAQWKEMRADWSPEQYERTNPSLQGSSSDFGSMRGQPESLIEAEKWRRLATAAMI